jgi:hypothetical protein
VACRKRIACQVFHRLNDQAVALGPHITMPIGRGSLTTEDGAKRHPV